MGTFIHEGNNHIMPHLSVPGTQEQTIPDTLPCTARPHLQPGSSNMFTLNPEPGSNNKLWASADRLRHEVRQNLGSLQIQN